MQEYVSRTDTKGTWHQQDSYQRDPGINQIMVKLSVVKYWEKMENEKDIEEEGRRRNT